MPMDADEILTCRILASLAALPRPDETVPVQAAISRALKKMSIYRILELRQRIENECNPNALLVRATIDLIDGQIALREIAGGAGWR